MTADCYMYSNNRCRGSVVQSRYQYLSPWLRTRQFSRGPPEIKCLLGKHESSVCSGETSIPKSAINLKLSHAPVGLSYYAVNASSGDAVKSIY